MRSWNNFGGGRQLDADDGEQPQQHITRVSEISPFNCNNLTLRLKVDNKTNVRTYTNQKGEGRMFSVDLVDETGEIKCTVFNEFVDQYEHVFQVGKVYKIFRAGIKPGNPKFCRTPYEMSINRSTVVSEDIATASPMKRRYNFVPAIDALQDVPVGQLVDTIGVVYDIGDLQTFTSKQKGEEFVKRSVRIADHSNRNVEITFWNEHAQNLAVAVGSVLAIKGGKVNEFKNEKSVSITTQSRIECDPDLPETPALSQWYSQNGDSIPYNSYSLGGQGGGGASQGAQGGAKRNDKIETIADLQEQAQNGESKKAVYVKVKGTITWINHDDRAPLYYKSCPDNNKKVIENKTDKPGRWICEATGQTYDDYNVRYILSAAVGDITGSQIVTIFNDHAEQILGVKAKDVEQLKEGHDAVTLNNIFEAALYKRYLITLKATEEMYQDELKLRCIVQGIDPLDFVAESRRLLEEILQYVDM